MPAEALKTVLVVDDEALFLSSVAEALAAPRGALSVVTAPDGAQALALLRQQAVDLLITDLKMPVLDGFELLKEFMRLQPGKPALVLTAHGSPEMEEHLRLIGGVSYLEKPIDLGALQLRIDEMLRPRTQGHIEGITLFGFLQLLEIERKTCTLLLRFGARRAMLCIRAGELVHAEADGLGGDRAVLQLGDWEAPEIDIEHVCRPCARTVHSRLTELLMEAARLADERREYGPRDPEPTPTPVRGAGRRASGVFPASFLAAAPAGERQGERLMDVSRRWWEQADLLKGVALPEHAIALRLSDGASQALRGDSDAAWSPALAELVAQARAVACGVPVGALEYVGERFFVGLLWQDDDALVVASALADPAAASPFHSQFGALSRKVPALDPLSGGE